MSLAPCFLYLLILTKLFPPIALLGLLNVARAERPNYTTKHSIAFYEEYAAYYRFVLGCSELKFVDSFVLRS